MWHFDGPRNKKIMNLKLIFSLLFFEHGYHPLSILKLKPGDRVLGTTKLIEGDGLKQKTVVCDLWGPIKADGPEGYKTKIRGLRY